MTPEDAYVRWLNEVAFTGSGRGDAFLAGAAWAAEECAKMVEPKGTRGCDCKQCYCDKPEDAARAAEWDEGQSNAAAIRARFAVKEGE